MAILRTETNGFTNVGSPTSGNEITFNNTGTDLESNLIDNAIKEVNTKVNSIEDGDGTPTFTSSDVADGSATSWTSVAAVTSGETHKSLLAKMSQMFKNIRYLYKMLGTTDISSIGNGTVTNAISTLNSNLGEYVYQINTIEKDTSTMSGSGIFDSLGTMTLVKKGSYLIGWSARTRGNTSSATLAPDDNVLMKSTTIGFDSFVRLTGSGIGWMGASQTNEASCLYFVKTNTGNTQLQIGVGHWNGNYKIHAGQAYAIRLK